MNKDKTNCHFGYQSIDSIQDNVSQKSSILKEDLQNYRIGFFNPKIIDEDIDDLYRAEKQWDASQFTIDTINYLLGNIAKYITKFPSIQVDGTSDQTRATIYLDNTILKDVDNDTQRLHQIICPLQSNYIDIKLSVNITLNSRPKVKVNIINHPNLIEHKANDELHAYQDSHHKNNPDFKDLDNGLQE